MNLFGQSLLASRRIIQAGGKFVTVFWDTYGHFANGWDTHSNHYPRLKDFLLPVFDHSFPAFLRDLQQTGLLDDTLVLCLSEHGRTPQLNNRKGGGREHWSRVYSVLLAGAGIAKGRVVGESDKIMLRKFTHLESNDDPFLGFELRQGNLARVPILANCLAYLECELACHMDVDGDHDLFVGRIHGGGRKDGTPKIHLREHGFAY